MHDLCSLLGIESFSKAEGVRVEGKLTVVTKVRRLKILIGFGTAMLLSETLTMGSVPRATEQSLIGIEVQEVKAETKQKLSQNAKKCLRATNYYLPDHEVDSRYSSCARTEKIRIGKETLKVCPQFLSAVRMQGSGHVSFKGKKYRVHYSGNVELVSKTKCSTAIGAANQCLIPFVHIAADPQYFNMGDIIEVPELRYMRVPRADGKGEFIHPGYFIVGDTGGAIKGNNRFDFFTGKGNPMGKENPFGPYGKKMTDEGNCMMSFKRISKSTQPGKVARMTKSVIASATGPSGVIVAGN